MTAEYRTAIKPVLVLLNGGTLDAQRYDHTETYKQNRRPPVNVTPLAESLVPAALDNSEHGRHCEFRQLPMHDSKDFFPNPEKPESDAHAEMLCNNLEHVIRHAPQQLVVVTFGTDRLADMARLMQARLADSGKTVIFTGAMEPLEHGWNVSDGFDTLDYTVKTALRNSLKPGVYAAMPDERGRRRILAADAALHKVKMFDADGRPHHYFAGNEVTLPDVARQPVR